MMNNDVLGFLSPNDVVRRNIFINMALKDINSDISIAHALIKKSTPDIAKRIEMLLHKKTKRDSAAQVWVLKDISITLSYVADILKRKRVSEKKMCELASLKKVKKTSRELTANLRRHAAFISELSKTNPSENSPQQSTASRFYRGILFIPRI